MKIFVSYSQADEKWAQWLRARLSQEGFEVWAWILRKQRLIRATKDVEETIRRVVASLHRSPEPAAR